MLKALFSEVAWASFIRAGLGMGSSDVESSQGDEGRGERKGISCERTFGAQGLKGKFWHKR